MGKVVFISYEKLKERVSIVDVMHALNLTMKKGSSPGEWRGQCPVCEGGPRSLVITAGIGFTCHSARSAGQDKAAGDQIQLVAHVRQCETYAAAKWLVDTFNIDVDELNGTLPRKAGTLKLAKPELPERKSAGTVPKEKKLESKPQPEGKERDPAFKPEDYAKKLAYTHEDIQSLAPYLTPERAEELVIGHASNGIHRGRVAVLIRDHTGEPLFFISATDWKFPPRISI